MDMDTVGSSKGRVVGGAYRDSDVLLASILDFGDVVHMGASPGADSTMKTCFLVSYHIPDSRQPRSCGASPLQSISEAFGSLSCATKPAHSPWHQHLFETTDLDISSTHNSTKAYKHVRYLF